MQEALNTPRTLLALVSPFLLSLPLLLGTQWTALPLCVPGVCLVFTCLLFYFLLSRRNRRRFHYDSAGNRTKKLLDAATTNYYYDYIDRMTKAYTTAIGWDYWGNMSSIASHTYSWDDADRLTKFDNSTGTENDAVYAYLPGSGTRYKRTQDTTVEYFIYDGDNVVGSYTSGGTLNARYVTPGLDDNLSETRGGSQYYYMQDGLGSVRNVVDSSETLQNRYDHYAFGNNIGGAQLYGVDNTYWYTGREYEYGGYNATHYYRNRYYISGLGIFASRDAAWADMHRGWGYVGNMPTMLRDPYGLGPVGDFFRWLFGGGDDAEEAYDPSFEDDPNSPVVDPLGPNLGDAGSGMSDAQLAAQDAAGASQARAGDGTCPPKRWKPADPLETPTANGTPTWPTVRKRWWKNEALNNPGEYSEWNLNRMRQGLAAQYQDVEAVWRSYHLHHDPSQASGNRFNVRKIEQQDHYDEHYGPRL